MAAGSATVALMRGAPLLEAARIGAEQIADELGGLIPAKRHAAELAADALHRALGAAAREQRRPAAGPRPRARRDERRRGQRRRGAAGGRDRSARRSACTLELWSDPENDGELSCCSAQAVRGARELAHSLGMAHLSIDLRAEFRAGVVDGWLADHAAGLTPNPCVRCNGNVRLDAMLELAAAARRRRRSPPATTPASRPATETGRCCARPRTCAKDQSYVLSGLAPASLARLRFPLGDLQKPQVRELAEQAGLAVAAQARLAGPLLPGRHAPERLPRAPRRPRRRTWPDPSTADGRGARRARAAPIATRSGSATASASSTPEPAIRARNRHSSPTPSPSVRDPLCSHRRSPSSRSPCTVPGTWSTGSACAPMGDVLTAVWPIRWRPGATDGRESSLREAAERTAPGQLACLYSGDLVVGHGTACARLRSHP